MRMVLGTSSYIAGDVIATLTRTRTSVVRTIEALNTSSVSNSYGLDREMLNYRVCEINNLKTER